MKKVLALILALLMVCSLVACGKKGGDDEDIHESADTVALETMKDAVKGSKSLTEAFHEDVLEAYLNYMGWEEDDYVINSTMNFPGDLKYTVELADGTYESSDAYWFDVFKSRYADNYDLEVDDVKAAYIKVYADGDDSSYMVYELYAAQIDGSWYLDPDYFYDEVHQGFNAEFAVHEETVPAAPAADTRATKALPSPEDPIY